MRWKRLPSLLCAAAFAAAAANSTDTVRPEFLSFDDLSALSRPIESDHLAGKLARLLETPFVSRRGQSRPTTGPVEIVFWNVDRGREWTTITKALRDPAGFRRDSRLKFSQKRWAKALRDIDDVKRADVVVLNEVDLGMKRTGYADVSSEIADTLNMNRVFGVEFVEIDRLYTGEERIRLEDPTLTDNLAADLKVDPKRYRGLHGNAVLSRFPIESAAIHRLPDCYDWFEDEMKAIAALEKGRRWSAKQVFQERLMRQVRRGGRMALVVKVGVPAVPGGTLTVVSTHLEDRATPSCRQDQLTALLDIIRDIEGPVVLAGDLNTTGSDGTPTSIRREIMKRVTDEAFWGQQAINWFTPLTIPRLLLWPLNYWKNFRDPTAIHIPVLAPNRERGLFTMLKDFRFADGGVFEFTGDSRRNGNGRGGTLATTNERAWKGFRPSFEFERNYLGLVGAFRLDWLLVKRDGEAGLVPSRPRTFQSFNRIVRRRLSDHHPIAVQLVNIGERVVRRAAAGTNHRPQR